MPQHVNPNDPVLRVCVVLIAICLVFGALQLAGDVFAPMVLGAVTGVILAPVTDALERRGLPGGLAAAIVLVVGLSGLAVLGVLIEPLIWQMAEQLPRIKWELRGIIAEFRGLVRGLDAVNQEVEEALGSGNAGESPSGGGRALPSVADTLLLAPYVGAQLLVMSGTLFFFLLTRKGIYAWLARFIGSPRDTAILLERFTTAERLVARYFLTISVINAGLGAALSTGLVLIGLPGPLIWGIAAMLLNYILYVGPMTVVAGLILAGLIAFEGLMVFAPAAIFLALNMIEAQFVTPALLGRHMSVNPLLIFVSLVFWLWIWGPIGGIVAIPVLVIVLVMLDIFDNDDNDGASAGDAEEAQEAPGPGRA